MMHADLIVRAGRIFTMHRPQSVVQAMAVVAGRIVATGTPGRIRAWKGPRTEVLDVGDRVVVPGLIDCHTHLFEWAMALGDVSLAGVASLHTALRKIASHARRIEPGQWLIGHGFDKNVCGGAFPTAGDLDAATGRDVSACIHSRDVHAAWVNTRVLRSAGITADTPDPPGGRIVRDHRGRPTGILLEKAVDLLSPSRSVASVVQVRRLWRRACREAWSYGLTGVHSVDGIEGFEWFQRLAAEGELGLRVRYAFPCDRLDALEQLRLLGGYGDDFLRVSAVKVFSDGALGSQTAWMYRAYPGRPGYYGIPVTVGAELRQIVRRAGALSLPCWIHAIGDRAVHEVASALVSQGSRSECGPLRHRIEHAQCVRPRTARLIVSGKITTSIQPSHLCQDIPIADTHWPSVVRFAYPLGTLKSAGILMAFGSDVPVESPNPYLGIFAAATRTMLDGYPSGGWHPEQRVDRRTALAGYTIHAARSVGESDRLGRLVPGAWADFAVLSDNPLTCPIENLVGIRSVCTVISGQRVYEP